MSDQSVIVGDVESKPRDATAEERRRWSERELLEWIAERQEEQMAAIDDLRASIAGLQSAENAENAELASLAGALQSAEATITQLQTQVSQGGGVSEADLEALANSVNQVAQAAQAATSSAASAGGGAAPVDGGSTGPLPPSGTDTGGTAAPAGGTDTGTTGAPAERTVYTFDGDPTTVDAAVWPTAPVLTTDTPPRQLYYFSGDTAPGQASGDGVGGVWHVYTGSTQPVPQAAEAQAEVTPGEGSPDPTLAAGAGASAGSELAPGGADVGPVAEGEAFGSTER